MCCYREGSLSLKDHMRSPTKRHRATKGIRKMNERNKSCPASEFLLRALMPSAYKVLRYSTVSPHFINSLLFHDSQEMVYLF